jgi:NADH-quinone oxidoreductase subunit N
MVFLGVEMASVPSYVLAGMLKGRRQSSEAALKYAVYGAGTAGIMLYGISLLAGVLGSVHIPTMAVRLAELLRPENLEAGIGLDKHMVLVLGGLMVMVGVAFKLSAVPFHFWCPDVFEGASAEVNAFLSVASKAAALALLVRLAIGFGQVPHGVALPTAAPVALFSVADSDAQTEGSGPAADQAALAPSAASQALAPAREFIAKLLAFVAVITCTFGNLAAYGQTNIKRLLAYSTIAQAGYMIMPIAAAVTLLGSDSAHAQAAIGALTFYVAVYLFMNLGAFAIVALLRNSLHSEEIADYAGLIRRSPLVVVCFSLILFSLIGLPPLAGFSGKFLIFASLWDSGLVTVLAIAGLNTAISLFYYLRVVKVMAMDPEPDNRLPISFAFIPSTFIVALTLPVLAMGLWWDGLNQWALAAAAHLFS